MTNSQLGKLPLVVAATGHRDLLVGELDEIRSRVRKLFLDLTDQYPDLRVTVMSPLAEGADMLIAEVAIELGLDLLVPLPMPEALYLQDFDNVESRVRFDNLCGEAKDVFELPLLAQTEAIPDELSRTDRDIQYAQLGVFLSAHCHILLALWDGKPASHLGGTAQVVNFHHNDLMPGYTPKTVAPQQMLIDDESDLVYHIACSRDRPNGQPHSDFSPLQCSWFTNDAASPRSKEMPQHHKTIFRRTSEFSHDAARFEERIVAESYPLLDVAHSPELPIGIDRINRYFCLSDWLAIFYQRKTLVTLRVTHSLAFLMGFMFVLYSDLETVQSFLFAFFIFFVAATGVQKLAKKRAWHRKYLDYRALAEGLRVQFYWAAAGVTNKNKSKFTHDIYLQTKDPEMGWIRNVMRVGGIRCDATPNQSFQGLEYAVREWIGDENTGQLGYYRRKAEYRSKRHRFTDWLGRLSLGISAIVVVLFLLVGTSMSDLIARSLTTFMGTMLVLFAVRHGFSYATAEKELIRQYNFMLRIFSNARRRLATTTEADEQRQVLSGLGGYALDEHAVWILMHRERSIDQSEIWRLGSGS